MNYIFLSISSPKWQNKHPVWIPINRYFKDNYTYTTKTERANRTNTTSEIITISYFNKFLVPFFIYYKLVKKANINFGRACSTISWTRKLKQHEEQQNQNRGNARTVFVLFHSNNYHPSTSLTSTYFILVLTISMNISDVNLNLKSSTSAAGSISNTRFT